MKRRILFFTNASGSQVVLFSFAGFPCGTFLYDCQCLVYPHNIAYWALAESLLINVGWQQVALLLLYMTTLDNSCCSDILLACVHGAGMKVLNMAWVGVCMLCLGLVAV
jgi:hypothetical protein